MPADDFGSRIAAAMKRASQAAPPSATSVPQSPPPAPTAPAADAFNERIRSALQTASGQSAPAQLPPGEWEYRTMARGDTLAGIAAAANVTVEEIWNHPQNEELHEDHDSPAALEPGTVVFAPPPANQAADEQPVGQGDYVVRKGDCLASIAYDTGYFWETIWDEAANSELRERRQDPNVLLAGDRLTIPPKERKDEPIAAEQRHRFVRRGEPSYFNATIRVADQPVTGKPYDVYVNHKKVASGTTTSAGSIAEVPIPGNAHEAIVVLNPGTTDQTAYRFELGEMPTVAVISGVQARLNSLGFECQQTGRLDPRTVSALSAFQMLYNLPVSGQPDQPTRDLLKSQHGS